MCCMSWDVALVCGYGLCLFGSVWILPCPLAPGPSHLNRSIQNRLWEHSPVFREPHLRLIYTNRTPQRPSPSPPGQWEAWREPTPTILFKLFTLLTVVTQLLLCAQSGLYTTMAASGFVFTLRVSATKRSTVAVVFSQTEVTSCFISKDETERR